MTEVASATFVPLPMTSFANEHEAFAASRVSQYVYVPTNTSSFATIDTYIDANGTDVKKPLVVVGDEGSGKSAMLANWAAKRRDSKVRREFIFQHVVGCSTPSLQLAHTLARLETALKEHFQLREMKVPDNEEDLRWALNRFLAAAAKKQIEGTIIIIIDGVHLLKSSCGPDGVLYWLPTDLPPGVRLILSTIHLSKKEEKSSANAPARDLVEPHEIEVNENQDTYESSVNRLYEKKDWSRFKRHPTFVELERRQCHFLAMEPLVMSTIGSIVRKFLALQPIGSRSLLDHHIFAVMTCPNSKQPMFLRSLLQSLQLTLSFTSITTDILIEKFLMCTNSHKVIETSLQICYNALTAHDLAMSAKQNLLVHNKKSLLGFGNRDRGANTSHHSIVHDMNKENVFNDVPIGNNQSSNSLHHHNSTINYAEVAANIFSFVFASRNGLTLDEIWGAVFMHMKLKPDESMKAKMLPILTNFTMVVDNMHSFSHEVYREVVYSNYIKSKDGLVKLHNTLSRYFTQLQPCNRKLVVLPYHLEAAGSWSKVKNCLTDIDLFQKWWRNPKSKVDFLKFWVSLTSLNKEKRSRTSYDIVDEYVKSLDEYRQAKNPTDEELSNIILEIGDFLLEFATLGHERNCDVPNFFHPQIPTSDLKNVGVPYLGVDKFGRSIMTYPDVIGSLQKSSSAEEDGRDEGDTNRLLQDIPVCTSYFFQRWMWIQYPYVALGNCDSRFTKGVDMKIMESKDYAPVKQTGEQHSELKEDYTEMRRKLNSAPDDGTKSKNLNSLKLPELKFNRKATKSFRRVPVDNGVDNSVVAVDKVTQRLLALQDDILNHKEEHDFMVQTRSALERRLYQMKGIIVDLQRSGESSSETTAKVEEAERLEREAQKKVASVTTLNTNLNKLKTMCDRHPAKVPALLDDLEIKSEQDSFLIGEIKKRLFEQSFEKMMHGVYFKQMKKLVTEGLTMHNQLLKYRYMMKKQLQVQQLESEQRLRIANSESESSLESNKDRAKQLITITQGKSSEESTVDHALVSAGSSWIDTWNSISARTGIIEPDIFFDRINNGKVLEEQISSLRKASEARLDNLKKEFAQVESELEEIRGAFQNGGGLEGDHGGEHAPTAAATSAGGGGGGGSSSGGAAFTGSAGGFQNESSVVSVKSRKKELDTKIALMKYHKEKSEMADQSMQKAESGLRHLAAMIGIPSFEDDLDFCATQMLNEIETMLETLMNEREKFIQQAHLTSQSHSSNSSQELIGTGRLPSPLDKNQESVHRPPELDYIIAKYEEPIARLPSKLPSRCIDVTEDKKSKHVSSGDGDDDDSFDDDIFNRTYIKSSSIKVLKTEMKKLEKKSKDQGKGSKDSDEVKEKGK